MTSIKDILQNSKSNLRAIRPERCTETAHEHPASSYLNERNGSYKVVEIDQIKPDQEQPRKFFDERRLEELAASIRQKGVLQPVIVRLDDDKNIVLLAGERRWRAAKMAGLKQIPAILRNGDNALEVSLIENLQRENLNPVEEAESLGRMCAEFHYTQQKLALVLGKSQSTINEILILNRLPEEIKAECRNTDIFPRRLLVEIAKQGDPDDPAPKLALFQKVKDGNLSADAVRSMTRKRKENTVRSFGEIVSGRVISLSTLLEMLIFEQLDMKTKGEILLELERLKKIIDGLLMLNHRPG